MLENNLKFFRKCNNLTQEQLGKYLGVGRQFICAIESGRCRMPQDKKDRLFKNENGWDLSALQRSNEQLSISQTGQTNLDTRELINELRIRIKSLEEERDRYWIIIQNLLRNQK